MFVQQSCFETKMFVCCRSFFETKKYEKKSWNETTTFQQKICLEVNVAGQISYFETTMLEISLSKKAKC